MCAFPAFLVIVLIVVALEACGFWREDAERAEREARHRIVKDAMREWRKAEWERKK